MLCDFNSKIADDLI